jgi:hypothetical protein
MDRQLQGQGPPLLAHGSAYAGIYTGGAAETHFCASTMGLDDLFRAKYPLRLFIILLFSIFSLVRVVVLLAIEFVLAFVDVQRWPHLRRRRDLHGRARAVRFVAAQFQRHPLSEHRKDPSFAGLKVLRARLSIPHAELLSETLHIPTPRVKGD